MRYSTAKLVNTALFDRTNGAANGYAQRLNGSANERYGLAKSISVMPGDVIQAEVYAKYVDPVSSNWNGALATLMTQIAGGAAGVVVDGSAYATSTGSFPFAGLLSTNDTGAPRAYLNWLVFDRNYGFITGGFRQISTTAKEAGTDVAHELIAMPQAIIINQPGYVYIYLSNENATPVEVYFDDFKVTHTKSPVIQQDDYYPFGLTFNSYQRENATPNQYLNQGKELQDELGINLYDFEWRQFDPTIGRTTTMDPHADSYHEHSPFSWLANNPMIMIDPDGQDYGVYIDHENKRITIKGTYYALSSDVASAQQATGFWNNQSGNYTYTVGSGDDAVEYAVNFDLSVKEVTVDAGADPNATLQMAFGADKSGEANVYQVQSDGNFKPNTNGSTQEGNQVAVRNSRQNSDTGAHEVGHTLGLTHSSKGIMTTTSTSSNRSNTTTDGNITQMLRYPLRGEQNSSAGKGTVHEETHIIQGFHPDYYKHNQSPVFIDVRRRDSKGNLIKMKKGKVD